MIAALSDLKYGLFDLFVIGAFAWCIAKEWYWPAVGVYVVGCIASGVLRAIAKTGGM